LWLIQTVDLREELPTFFNKTVEDGLTDVRDAPEDPKDINATKNERLNMVDMGG
jgi:hypothetical protein